MLQSLNHPYCSFLGSSLSVTPSAWPIPIDISHQGWTERGRIPCLDLLAMLCLLQLRRLLVTFVIRVHCWFMVSMLSIRTLKDFPLELFSRPAALSMHWCFGLFLPKSGTLHLLLLDFTGFLSAHFSSLWRSLCMTAWLSSLSATALGLCPVQFCWDCSMS